MKSTTKEMVASGVARDAVYLVLMSTVARVVFEDGGDEAMQRLVTNLLVEMGSHRD